MHKNTGIVSAICTGLLVPMGILAAEQPEAGRLEEQREAPRVNPYCVSGLDWRPGRGMEKLGMPGGIDDPHGSLCYNWGYDINYNGVLAMVNPSWRQTHFGREPARQSYDVEKKELVNPEWLRDFVQKNPGRVWMIGNEPDNPQLDAGDGLTPKQYAEMYHTYHAFIRPLDPEAKFAVGALYAASEPGEFEQDRKWWNQVLEHYKDTYGRDMPVDIWTNHCYSVVGRLDPERIIETYFIPFRHYVDTVSDGIYEDKPIWLTEFGVAMWATALHPDYMAEFIEQLCPRLEKEYKLPSGKTKRVVDRFFWFVGYFLEGQWQDSALVTKDLKPTPAGAAYARLARNYPNPLPPLPAEPPAPPQRLRSDFEMDATPWRPIAGEWVVEDGAYHQRRLTGPWNIQTHLPYAYEDVEIACDVRINKTEEPNHWAGIQLRHGTVWKDRLHGYLVYLRANGELGISVSGQKEAVATLADAVEDASTFHRLRVTLRGHTLTVHLDDQQKLEWTDPEKRFDRGLVSLIAGRSDCTYDNVDVRVAP